MTCLGSVNFFFIRIIIINFFCKDANEYNFFYHGLKKNKKNCFNVINNNNNNNNNVS